MKKWLVPICAIAAFAITRPNEIPFEKITIDLGSAEPAAFADVNHDGKLDIVAGENWYEAPRWTKHHFRDIDFRNGYIDDFSDLMLDVNNDGYPDVVSCAWFAKRIWWNENPGKKGGAWKDHSIQEGFNVEFAFLADIDNDGKAREVLPELAGSGPNGEGGVAWYEIQNGAFVKHVVSATNPGHGIGAGDVNGDGRNDILTPKGWYEAPPNPRTGDWKFHQDFDLGQTGFIYVLDVNGDGRPDLVTSMAHDYGIFWMEHAADGKWVKHMIDDTWSQSHAMTMVDLRGDGHQGFLTGKRFMAHDHDPGVREPLGVYWYEPLKVDDPKNGNVSWVKHVIDYSTRTGGGMQIPAADIDGDGHLDFAVGGKSGLYLFRNLTH
jgi:FG-GAP-like repeat